MGQPEFDATVAFDKKLSPLEMLEKRMAGTLIADRRGNIEPPRPTYRPRVDTSISTDANDEWTPQRRDSVASMASTSSGILDSFRLSTLEIDQDRHHHQDILSRNAAPPQYRTTPASLRGGPIPNRAPLRSAVRTPMKFFDAVVGGGTVRSPPSSGQDASQRETSNCISAINDASSSTDTSNQPQRMPKPTGGSDGSPLYTIGQLDNSSSNSISPISPTVGGTGFGSDTANSSAGSFNDSFNARNRFIPATHARSASQESVASASTTPRSIGSPVPSRKGAPSPLVGCGSSVASPVQSPNLSGSAKDTNALATTPRRVSSGRDQEWKSTLPVVDARRFQQMTTEEHVATGIKHHEHGDLRQGSYHWQHAAFKGDPTGMLLYGLAVRHGWGVRKNPEEAVQWLRKAMESTVSADGSLLQEYRDNKTKRSQAGLAFYELGMSYLHSWGIEKDEAMALKSFEMAAELDDVDGLCEAAALYMHSGKGRKKDLMRAAALYRRAGELGASMVGQSWIYKDKYMKEHKDKKHKN